MVEGATGPTTATPPPVVRSRAPAPAEPCACRDADDDDEEEEGPVAAAEPVPRRASFRLDLPRELSAASALDTTRSVR